MHRIEYFFFQVALELASHMDLQKVAMEERLPIYKAEQVVIVNKYDHADPNLRKCKAKYINFSLIGWANQVAKSIVTNHRETGSEKGWQSKVNFIKKDKKGWQSKL